MCILLIRSWPCGHSRCTSADVCMDALSMPGRAPYDCPHATHSFSRQAPGSNWPCPVCTRRQHSEAEIPLRDHASRPASMSSRKLQQQAIRLQQAARQQQGQRAADLRKASLQLQQDREDAGLPPLPIPSEQYTVTGSKPAHKPRSSHETEDLLSLSSASASPLPSPETPMFVTGTEPLWTDVDYSKGQGRS